jgi:glycolate oxidase
VLTGEHGVGVEKRDLMPAMFTEADLAQQQRLKCAFDDRGLLNPGKVFPTGRGITGFLADLPTLEGATPG